MFAKMPTEKPPSQRKASCTSLTKTELQFLMYILSETNHRDAHYKRARERMKALPARLAEMKANGEVVVHTKERMIDYIKFRCEHYYGLDFK